MHPCLLIPELALCIIHFLADDRASSHTTRYLKNASDVARLAQTCKVLAEPALDILWRTQHSLSPLVMCLPSDVWELTKRGKTISFKRDPTPLDWAFVQKYTHRIRAISQPTSFSFPRLDENALSTLITPSNFGALFPNLQALDYSVVSVAAPMIQLLTDVLSTERHLESITSLSVICPRASHGEEVYNLFQAIRTKARRLETLRIESFTSACSDPSLAVKLLHGDFQLLRKLELSWSIHVSAECLACLVGMQYLQEISLSLRKDIDLDFLSNGCAFNHDTQIERTFPALKSLKVLAHSLDQCTALLSLVTSAFLETITFSYDVQAPSRLIEAFFRQAAKTCRGATDTPSDASTTHRAVSLILKHNLGPYSSASSPFVIHPSQTLFPLLALRHLRILRLLHLGTIAIDDAFLREAANAWGGHLQELEECGIPWVGVEESSFMPGFVAATLDGIGAFVSGCSRLERLRIAFDGRGVPQHEEVCPKESQEEHEEKRERKENDKGDACEVDSCQESGQEGSTVPSKSSALQVLNVRDSPIDDPESVAKFLKHVAPALRVICVEGSLDMWRKWREVENQMKLTGTC